MGANACLVNEPTTFVVARTAPYTTIKYESRHAHDCEYNNHDTNESQGTDVAYLGDDTVTVGAAKAKTAAAAAATTTTSSTG